MKKIILLASIMFSLNTNKIIAQDADFAPGWYIVEKNCQFSGGTDASGQAEKESLSVGEVVFAYMKSNGVFFCISPSKEDLYIKGSLTKITSPGKVGVLTETISLMDSDLGVDEAFWVTGIDAGSGQATILLAGGQKQNVPSKSISIEAKYLNKMVEALSFNNVNP